MAVSGPRIHNERDADLTDLSVKIRGMRCPAALAVVTALVAWTTATERVRVHASVPHTHPQQLVLEVRVFSGHEEVTRQTRITIHKAGERSDALPHPTTQGDGAVELLVPAGIYDLQAIHERDGRVLNIRWANRLVVMPYPDEGGRHLEVINFRSGYGALQLRSDDAELPDVAIYEASKREKTAGTALASGRYVLFVVPAGLYDVQVRKGPKVTWMSGVEVPLDRTRLSIVK